MYKSFRKKKLYVAFNKFRETAKSGTGYENGITYTSTSDSYNLFLVAGLFRIIISYDKNISSICG